MIHKELKFQEYKELLGITQSKLKLLKRSPAHFHVDVDAKSSEALTFGKLYDTLLLTPGWFEEEFLICEEKPRKGSKAYDELLLTARDREIISTEDYKEALNMVDVAKSHLQVSELLSGAEAQLSITWGWDSVSIPCKGRPDLYNAELKAVIDLKTTKDARPSSFQKDAYNFGYFNQLAFYADGCAKNGLEVENCYIIAQEKEAPFGVMVYKINQESLARAHQENNYLVELYAQCVDSKTFPCYPGEIFELSMPTWA